MNSSKKQSSQSTQLNSFKNIPCQSLVQPTLKSYQNPAQQSVIQRPNEKVENQPQSRCSLVKGIIFGCFGATMLHSNRVLFRLQYDLFYVSPNEAIFYRSLLFFLITLAYSKYKRVDVLNIPKTNNTRKWLYFRCVAGFLSSWGIVNSLNLIQYSKSVILTFTYPLFTIIFARIILKEKIHFLEIIAICTGFLGVCLYANPQWLGGKSVKDINNQEGNDGLGKYQILGIAFTMVSSISQAMVVISLRKIGKEVDKSIPQLYFALVSVVFFPSLYFTQNLYKYETNDNYVQTHNFTWMFLVLILFQGIFSFLGQILWQLAYIYEKAARVAAISYLEIILAFVFEALLFHGVIQISDIVAAFLIVGCSFLIAILKCTKVLK